MDLLDGTNELGRIVLFQTSPNTTFSNISSENVGTYSQWWVAVENVVYKDNVRTHTSTHTHTQLCSSYAPNVRRTAQ